MTTIPRPMRVMVKGWWKNREMTYAEAEAYHLHTAAKLVGTLRQAHHLFQAKCNRVWGEYHPAPPRMPQPPEKINKGRDHE